MSATTIQNEPVILPAVISADMTISAILVAMVMHSRLCVARCRAGTGTIEPIAKT
jgi:hypothetical protein